MKQSQRRSNAAKKMWKARRKKSLLLRMAASGAPRPNTDPLDLTVETDGQHEAVKLTVRSPKGTIALEFGTGSGKAIVMAKIAKASVSKAGAH